MPVRRLGEGESEERRVRMQRHRILLVDVDDLLIEDVEVDIVRQRLVDEDGVSTTTTPVTLSMTRTRRHKVRRQQSL